VLGNYIGLNATGTAALPKAAGIRIDSGAALNIIGGVTTNARNVISGNALQGVVIFDGGSDGTVIQANYVGLNPGGNAAIPNGDAGIELNGGQQFTVIGGTLSSTRNVISGNLAHGVAVFDSNASVIQGNYLGLSAAGTNAIPNQFAGIEINGGSQSNLVGGLTLGAGNVLSGNHTQGIFINSPGTVDNIVEGNFIGTDPLGISAIGNQFAGIEINGGTQSNIIGGTVTAARNVISGNGIQGIHIDGLNTDANQVQGNFIGMNVAGAASLGNGGSGIELCCGSRSNILGGAVNGAGNLISGNSNYGIVLGGVGTDGTIIQGNLIGTDISGASSLGNAFDGVLVYGGAQHTQIGGNLPGMRNIISGNFGSGVSVFDPGTQNNFVQGNFLGLNVSGNAALANGGAGVVIGGGCSSNAVGGGVGFRNIISGNLNSGVIVQNTNTTANFVQGNTIGLDATSTQPVPNQNAGVTIVDAAQLNQIGGTTLGTANLIASNSFGGVELFNTATTNNSVLGNSIFGNGINGLGLNGTANNLRNAPTITSAVLGTNLVVGGSLKSSSNAIFRIEFFANSAGSSGQGQTFLGAISATMGAGGTLNFSAGLASTVPVGQLITATATDPTGNTSPFSNVGTVTTTDSVGDGIPNAWRAAFFGGSGTTTNSSSCTTCDPDHDGFTNLQEFYAGTNPQTNSSAFRVISVKTSGPDVTVTFFAVTGKIYRLEKKDDMALPTWTLLADQLVGPPLGVSITNFFTITDPGAAALPKRFYRADVLP
jgi:titin